jgi:hypothetical protein
VDVGGLFPDDGSYDASDAAEFNLDAVVRCFVACASDGNWVFALGCDDDMDEARLGGGCHHGEAGRRSFRVQVQQQGKGKTVADVRGEIKVVLGGFPVFVARRDLAGGSFNEHVERFGKRGAALNVMVAYELNHFVLRKNCSLVIEGTISKVKGKAGCDAIPVGNLNKITNSEGATLQRLEDQKAMKRSLGAADGDGVRGERFYCEKGR